MLSASDTGRPLVALVAADELRAEMELALEPVWFELAGVAESVEDLLTLPPAELDVLVRAAGPGCEVAEEIRELRSRFPACRVVIAGACESAAAARTSLRAGADGYVPQTDLTRRLSLTVAAVLVGQLCVPSEARLGVAPPVLSYREREVLQLAACGMTNSSIAAQLYLSESTVKTHLSSTFRKLGVTSRAEAALALARVADTLGTPLPNLAEASPEPATLTSLGA